MARAAGEVVIATLGLTLAIALGAMLALWLVSLWRRDASLVDLWWGPGIALQAAAAYALQATAALGPGATARSPLLVALAAVWGLRLGGYLVWRNHGRGEDPRYQAMRRHWGARFPWVSLATVFGLQGVLQWAVSLPMQLALLAPGARPLGGLDGLGIALFALGLAFETLGDAQLARFRADPVNRGRVLDSGLWRYTRHPNYFGDALAHWGLFAIALATPYGAFGVVGPALMTFLLLRVSGVALLERSIGRRRPEYAAYQRRTSAFLPWPPRGD